MQESIETNKQNYDRKIFSLDGQINNQIKNKEDNQEI